MVAGAGLEPATSRLWAWRAANCSTPRYALVWALEYGIQNQPSRQTNGRIITRQISHKTRLPDITHKAKAAHRSAASTWCRERGSNPHDLAIAGF